MNHIISIKGFRCIYWIALAGGLTMIGACGASDKKEAEEKPAVEESPSTDVFLLQKGTLNNTIKIPGELIPYQQVDIYARVNGFVKKLYADVGTEVKEGQLLAVMEAPELSSQLAGAESRLKAQEAMYTASKANYDRLLETSKTPGTISPNDLDQAMAKKNADYAQLESARAAYKEIAETRNYLELRAPFNGVISTRNLNTGAVAGPAGKGSELPIFVLQDQRKLRLAVGVPEAATSYVNDKTNIQFTVKGRPNETFTAQVKRTAGSLDSKLRSERIEMDIANNDRKLLPGMIAEVSIPVSMHDSSFVVPKSAILNSMEGVYVIKVNNGLVQWVTVTTGQQANGQMGVYGDLSSGDTILLAGNEERRRGSAVGKVKVVSGTKQ